MVLNAPRATALVVALFTAACLAMAATLTVNSDMLALMPEDDPAIANLRTLQAEEGGVNLVSICLLYTSPSPRDKRQSRMPSSA